VIGAVSISNTLKVLLRPTHHKDYKPRNYILQQVHKYHACIAVRSRRHTDTLGNKQVMMAVNLIQRHTHGKTLEMSFHLTSGLLSACSFRIVDSGTDRVCVLLFPITLGSSSGVPITHIRVAGSTTRRPWNGRQKQGYLEATAASREASRWYALAFLPLSPDAVL